MDVSCTMCNVCMREQSPGTMMREVLITGGVIYKERKLFQIICETCFKSMFSDAQIETLDKGIPVTVHSA